MLPSLVHAMLFAVAPLQQEAIIARPLPRMPLPRPVANAPMASINQNRVPAGKLANGTLTVALDVVEAGWRPEGPSDPVVRVLALAEAGKGPSVPGPLLRAPVGTTVRLTLHNRSDSALMFGGFDRARAMEADTVHIAAGATREITFRLTTQGNFFYWGVVKGLEHWTSRDWYDSQLTGAFIVDPPGGAPRAGAGDRVFLITEWFHTYPDRPFESALVFNGRAWPHNDRITLAQNDSVKWTVINAAAVEHPIHLHGFYFKVQRRGGERGDTAVVADRQALQNMQVMQIGGSMQIAFVPTTPGNWVFHCHFASHVGDIVSLHGSPEAFTAGDTTRDHHGAGPGGHQMRGLVIGMHVTPAAGYKEPVVANRRTLNLFAQKKPKRLMGGQTAFGFALQRTDSAPARDSVELPGPVLELKRGEPVRVVVHNTMDEATGVHWHGLEIESYPDGVPGLSGMGERIMPPILPGESFAAEFTPPRSGTFPYHAHLHELRQIGSGLYGAIIVSDAPRDLGHDHLIVAGGGGLPVFEKAASPDFLLVNGRPSPRPITMTAGESNRIRLVSIHADWILKFRLGDDSTVARWTPIARDGADLPPSLQQSKPASIEMGPGETADFTFVPPRPGELVLEVWLWPSGQRVMVPVIVKAKGAPPG